MPNQTQLDQRIATAGRDHVQALRLSAEKYESVAVDFDAVAKLCEDHGSEAGEMLANIAKDEAAALRRSAAADLRRADHIVRYSA